MTKRAHDLSGEWRGMFNYPAGQPPTGFTASLHETGGRVTGSTVEPALSGGSVAATIDGRRTGATVSFVKLYDDDRDGVYDAVAYQGSIDPDATEISGRWSIPGDWSGSFIMVRDKGVETEAEAVAREEVD